MISTKNEKLRGETETFVRNGAWPLAMRKKSWWLVGFLLQNLEKSHKSIFLIIQRLKYSRFSFIHM